MSRTLRIIVICVLVACIGIAGLIIVRRIIVPSFTAVDGDYKYQFHRVDNDNEWKEFKVKYKGVDYCKDCHSEQYKAVVSSRHAKVQCENCHGPAMDHPENPAKLSLDKTRELCLRCHSNLPYRPSAYAELPKGPIELKMQDPDGHNPGVECIMCHSVHKADFISAGAPSR
jgi:predicted CXXCH cytochrome family protein